MVKEMVRTAEELEQHRPLWNTGKLPLPLKSIEEEFKVLRAREVLQFRESADPKVSGAGVAVKTGRKWRAEAAVEQAESPVRHRVLVGTVARGLVEEPSHPPVWRRLGERNGGN